MQFASQKSCNYEDRNVEEETQLLSGKKLRAMYRGEVRELLEDIRGPCDSKKKKEVQKS